MNKNKANYAGFERRARSSSAFPPPFVLKNEDRPERKKRRTNEKYVKGCTCSLIPFESNQEIIELIAMFEIWVFSL